MELPVLSPANEEAAKAFLLRHLSALGDLAQGAEKSLAEPAELEAGGVHAEDIFIKMFLQSQKALIEAALADLS